MRLGKAIPKIILRDLADGSVQGDRLFLGLRVNLVVQAESDVLHASRIRGQNDCLKARRRRARGTHATRPCSRTTPPRSNQRFLEPLARLEPLPRPANDLIDSLLSPYTKRINGECNVMANYVTK